MDVMNIGGWKYYIGDDSGFDKEKVGKWMYFFRGEEGRIFTEKCCRETVEQDIVCESKLSDSIEGVACFYLNIDDIERHKRIIQYFLDHDMIRRTKTGKLYNISFKLDNQTDAGAYGEDFKAELKLENLINLSTGEWLV